MNAAPKKAGDALTEGQKNALCRVVKNMAQQEAIAHAIAAWANAVAGFDPKDLEACCDAENAFYDIAILGDTISVLQGDISEALDQVFPGMSWSYKNPGFPSEPH